MILDGRKVKEKILDELKEKVSSLSEKPTLCVIQVGDDDASNIYINQKRKMCEYIGYNFIHKKLDEGISEEELLAIIDELNNDNEITSILVQMPLPKSINPKKIQNRVKKEKDVDGLNDENFINLINNRDCLIPCTAYGIVQLLEEYNIDIEGKNIVIVGRSSLVGMPLFHLLENKNATVTLCHSKTRDLKNITKNAEILVVAVGRKHLVGKQFEFKPTAILVDVGINRDETGLHGDILPDRPVKLQTPVPGGVGLLTRLALMENLLKIKK